MGKKHGTKQKPVEHSVYEIEEEAEATGIVPETEQFDAFDGERNKRKRRLKDELREQHQQKLTRQKKKRLNKYIEHQLRREEKEILMKKLEESTIDTSLLKSAKLIGSGNKQTKREQLTEALRLEAEGKATDETRELLYEKREVKNWEDELNSDDEESEFKDTESASTFVAPNFKPTTFTGFGFSNLKKVKKVKKRKGYTWKDKVEADEAKAKKDEEDADFDSDSDSEEVGGSSDESSRDEEVEGDDDDNDDDDDDDQEVEEEEPLRNKPHSEKAQDFKAWAEDQVRKMEERGEILLPDVPADFKPTLHKEDLDDGLREEYIPLQEQLERKIFTVDVVRSEEVQAQRVQLPVYGEEFRIMEAIHHNDCVIICGETGSGKTTQVPQFLFESGFGSAGSENPGMIGITEPRRVAAVSMANRVGAEMGNYGNKVAYQIRFDGNVKTDTAVKFMTDGVLLREMMTDFLLTKYSALIIDEAHERSVNTDILIGMLSRILHLRREYHEKDPARYKPLKLVIMSATLRVTDFSENKTLFKTPPPVLKVDARQYPVSVHFNRRTAPNYTEEAFRKTCKIHRRLPKGAILVFLTGKAEINDMVKRLRKEFPFPDAQGKRLKKDEGYTEELADVKVDPKNAVVEAEEIDFQVSDGAVVDDYDKAEEEAGSEGEEEEGFEETLEPDQAPDDPLYVLPLYSVLPTKEQMRIFEEPPKGSRLCVVATNVAETSLTIPGVRYVVDCGRSKERFYNEQTGVQSFEVRWISQASAGQRSGRAGRTGPGHCYRIYSSALFESDFAKFSRPEILRMPVESVVLNMKSMGIDNIVNFPFPTAPSRVSLSKAEKLLRYLGGLDDDKKVTDFGKQMSLFPVAPRFSKMVLIGNQQECLPYIIALVSALSVGDPFMSEFDVGVQASEIELSQEQLEQRRQLMSKFHKSRAQFSRLDKYSDSLRLLFAVCSSDHIAAEKRMQFYKDNFLNPKLMDEIRKLRKQLTYIVKVNTSQDSVASSQTTDKELKLGKPTKKQTQAIKQMVAAGFIDQVAIRADKLDGEEKLANNTRIINVAYKTAVPTDAAEHPYAFIHPSSVLNESGEVPPDYLVYQTLQTTGSGKLRMKPLNDIKAKALANVGKNSGLVTYSKPLGHPYAPKNISATERECYVVPRFGVDGTGSVGWDLPAVKVHQKKVRGSWKTV